MFCNIDYHTIINVRHKLRPFPEYVVLTSHKQCLWLEYFCSMSSMRRAGIVFEIQTKNVSLTLLT